MKKVEKTFAISKIDAGGYISKGVKYEVTKIIYEAEDNTVFFIKDNNGEELTCRKNQCCHLSQSLFPQGKDNYNWELVKELS